MQEQEKIFYNLTQENFDQYINECKYWIDFFGMYDWEIDFRFEEAKNENNLSMVGVLQTGASARFKLNTKWLNIKPTKYEIAKCAFHEVFELMTSRIQTMADDPDLSLSISARCEMAETEIHRIIRIFENKLFTPDYNNRPN